MRRELAEDRDVPEVGLEVADVGLVLDDRNAIDVGERIGVIDRLADAAL